MKKYTLQKSAGTLDTIKASGKKLWDDLDGTGLALTAGIGGLGGYLYDQATKDRASSALRSLLLAGGGAALGVGAYGLTKALTKDKPLVPHTDSGSAAPLFEFGLVQTPLTALAAVAAGRGAGALYDKASGKTPEAIKAKLNKTKDPAQRRNLQQELANAQAKAAPYGSSWRKAKANLVQDWKAGQTFGGKVRNVAARVKNYKGTLAGIKAGGVKGMLPRGRTAVKGVAGTLAALALSSPRLQEKVIDWLSET